MSESTNSTLIDLVDQAAAKDSSEPAKKFEVPGVRLGVQKLVVVVKESAEVSEPSIAGRQLGEFRRGASRRKRRACEMKFGPVTWRDTNQLVSKSVLVDRDADLYRELIHDATGKLLYRAEEKLSEHQGHGSDKRTRAD